MLILALDLARLTGFALGEAGLVPESGSWELRQTDEDVHHEPAAMVGNVLRLLNGRRPDLIAVEDYMAPAAQKSQGIIISQIMLHGAIHAWAGLSRIRLVRPAADSYRKDLFGRSRAPGENGTKEMVRSGMVAAGLLPANSIDYDRSDACAVWAWAEQIYGGVTPRLMLVAV